jgi:hypothetical protein
MHMIVFRHHPTPFGLFLREKLVLPIGHSNYGDELVHRIAGIEYSRSVC